MKKWFLILTVILLLACLGIWLALTKVAPFAVVLMNRYSNEQLSVLLQNKTHPEDFSLVATDIEVIVEDSIKLKGWHIPSKRSSNATVIVLHGVNASREFMLPTAKILTENGFNVVLFDSRGHGKSGGGYCTYGYYEKRDISSIVSFLLLKDSTQSVGIYGNSLGGAIALQAMAVDSRIKCGVVESTFSNLREVVSAYMERMFFVGPMFLSNIALDRASEMAKFDPDAVNPELMAKKINNPIFIAHGDSDEHINVINSQRIYSNIASTKKMLTIVRGADHYTLYKIGGNDYEKKVISFLRENLY